MNLPHVFLKLYHFYSSYDSGINLNTALRYRHHNRSFEINPKAKVKMTGNTIDWDNQTGNWGVIKEQTYR